MNKHQKELLESIRRERIEKEAPCYGKPADWIGKMGVGEPIRHEFAGGSCVYCGLHQPGNTREKAMHRFSEGL